MLCFSHSHLSSLASGKFRFVGVSENKGYLIWGPYNKVPIRVPYFRTLPLQNPASGLSLLRGVEMSKQA